MNVFDLPTPALIVDEETLEQNMERMDELLRGKRLRLRPHYKSNKCAAIAHRQMARGAVGITCAKLSEAEDLIFSGIDDVLIANQIVEKGKLQRLAYLAGLCRLTVCVDDIGNAEALSQAACAAGTTIHCLAEYEIGMDRCGVTDPVSYLALARQIEKLPHLTYDGIQAYAGHISHMTSRQEREALTAANAEKLRSLVRLLAENGITVSTISGGSTGTADIKAAEGLYTELQAGSYLFLDSTYRKLDVPFRNSLYVLATVVSRRPGLAVLDAGVKSLGVDQDPPVILTASGREIRGAFEANEEHLKIFDPSEELPVGEKVFIIPGHCCSTVNLYDQLYLFRNGVVTDRLAVTARGRSQ